MSQSIPFHALAPLALLLLTGVAACSPMEERAEYQSSRNAAQFDPKAQNLYALEEIRAGDFATAERKLRDTTRLGADDPYRLLNLALVLQMTGREEEAAALYGRVLEMEANPKAALASGFGRPVKDIAHTALAGMRNDQP